MTSTAAKTFPTLHVASCLTGIGMADNITFRDVCEIASQLFGASIWTHELVHEPTKNAYKSEGYRQFPDMPTKADAEANWQDAAAKAIAAYGETVTIEMGSHGRRESPLETFAAVAPNKPIVVIQS